MSFGRRDSTETSFEKELLPSNVNINAEKMMNFLKTMSFKSLLSSL
jgi:hypothetical protein